jgi:hypothetical protein
MVDERTNSTLSPHATNFCYTTLIPPARVPGFDLRISDSAFRRLKFASTNPSKPMSAKWPIGNRIAGKCEKQTQSSYEPCYQLLIAIFGLILMKFGSIAPQHGFQAGDAAGRLKANPSKPIEGRLSAINKMKPEWTEQTHVQHRSCYEQVTASFVQLFAKFERTAVPFRIAIADRHVKSQGEPIGYGWMVITKGPGRPCHI